MATTADYAAEGLLDGLEGRAREEREELLEWLHRDQGLDLDDLREASANGTLLFLAARGTLGGGNDHSAREVAELTGVPLDLYLELRRANGFPAVNDPDARELGPGDLESARLARTFLDAGLDRDQLIGTARVLGRGLGQVAELMRQVNLELQLKPGASERELAEGMARGAEQLVPLVGPLLEQVLRGQLRQVVQTEAITAAERESGSLPGAREVGIAFADLVGFTRLGEQIPPEELQRIAARLTDLATDVVPAPVRVIKTIGDAVMLQSPDPAALLRAAFALVERAAEEGEEFPQLRVGIAAGQAVSRAGDWFGRPVNLASRVTSVARAGSVLATEEVKGAVGDEVARFSFAGSRRLKGVPGEVRLYRARPRDA
jgi:adenylate cyclase